MFHDHFYVCIICILKLRQALLTEQNVLYKFHSIQDVYLPLTYGAGHILRILLISVVHDVVKFQYQLIPKATTSIILSLGYSLCVSKLDLEMVHLTIHTF